MPLKHIPPFVLTLIVIATFLGLWELAAQKNNSVIFFIGSPSRISEELVVLMASASFYGHFGITALEAFIGLVLGTGLGATIGISFWYFATVSKVLSPILLAFGAIPILVFAPLMIVWFGVGIELKIALAFLATFFVAYSQAMRGTDSVLSEQIDLLSAMGASRRDVFRMAVVPGSLHWVLGSMRVLVGLSLLGAFIGEFIAADRGLGYLILRSSNLYNMPRAMAAAVGIVVVAVMFNFLALMIERRRVAIARRLSVPCAFR